ncbi:MAG: hypothetical protein M3680_34730 [Myxococcota bacterium]|nr:hypothetical protein [Myxococcota bacterium]
MRRLLVLLLLASPASAQNAPHKEGDYGGVVPGEQPSEGPARPAKAKRAPARGTLTWVGFEAKDGGAQLFLQSVAPFEVSQRVEGGTLVVSLSLTKLAANTWRKVDTRFFDNPLAGVIAKAGGRKRGVQVRITFKNPKDAREAALRMATEPDGMAYAYLTFPPGSGASQPVAEPQD